ncbi:hypothetical protein OEA41_004125 [Lepraria neglecta]|uniref:MARVEL domain-containing protein n=1 Tax=Lepraria neglecta TaxID=209136 RepID=A0AAD9Z6U0_9LECA|nr:hypothetical protein OEA41_004125 [Lepraria neglecta]
MLDIIVLGICAIQFLFAIIILGLTGHIASDFYTPSQDSYELFCAVWTVLILLYLALAPRFFPNFAHPLAILGLNALTMLFWFAAFISMAVLHHQLDNIGEGDYYGDYLGGFCSFVGTYCPILEAAAVFGAFEWALFVATTILAALAAFRGHSSKSTTTTTTA